MKIKITILTILICFVVTLVYAVAIGYFPGLKQLIDKSDAIVILRIDKQITDQFSPTLYTTYVCYIYQTFKGEIPKNKQTTLQLMDTRNSFVPPFALNSTHLMFLTKKRSEEEPTEYRTIEFEGANIRLSPFGNEKMPKGKILEDKIKYLIKTSIEYWDKENKNEKEFLESIIKE